MLQDLRVGDLKTVEVRISFAGITELKTAPWAAPI